MGKQVDLEFMGGSHVGTIDSDDFEVSGNAFATSRVLDGSRDHGYAQEWSEPGTIQHDGDDVQAVRIYLFDADDIDGVEEAENYPWDEDHIARIVITE